MQRPDVERGERVLKVSEFRMESGVRGHVRDRGENGAYSVCYCERRPKFRAATSPTHQGLFILQRPLVGAVPCHGSAAAAAAADCVSLAGSPRLSLGFVGATRADTSLVISCPSATL